MLLGLLAGTLIATRETRGLSLEQIEREHRAWS
jgi:hypothetical protein